MKTAISKLTLCLSFLLSPPLSAHEGHDHDAPPKIQAPKGGIIKSLEKISVEVVVKKKNVKIYIYDSELKPQDVEGYKVSAQAELPRAKKKEPVQVVAKGSHFEAIFDAKGAHRYTLILSVHDPKSGHDDTLNFTVEPRK